MSELEVHGDPDGMDQQPEGDRAVEAAPDSELLAWARDARAANLIAQSLAKTSFVSTTMRGRADEITAAILTGQEVGLRPMSALRSIDVIQGTPAVRALAMRGLVQAHGHEVWVDEDETSESRAVVYGQRKGSDHAQRSVWTIDRAEKLGLAGKDNWRKQPGAMLIARATAEVCRLIASDVLLGMPYAIEELDDTGPSTPGEKPKPRKRRTAARKPLPPPEPPRLDEPLSPSPADASVDSEQPPPSGQADEEAR